MPVILTVEDEVLISEYLQDILSDSGHTVIGVSNADDAIAVLQARNDVSVIITDVNMPGSMDGLRLAAAVRGRWPPVKIIVTTGNGISVRDQMPAGSIFLPKPYDARSVLAAVEPLLFPEATTRF